MRPFNLVIFLTAVSIACPLPLSAKENAAIAPEFKKNETGILNDVFQHNIHEEITHYLKLDHLGRKLTGKKLRAKSVNVFDEVPDNTFFTNRHGKKPLSAEELQRGYEESLPDPAETYAIFKGKFVDENTRVFARDGKGKVYFLKFDMPSHPGLGSASEMISSRIYHALGYNVPQNTILYLPPEQITAAEDGKIYDNTGFKKKLTPELLERQLMFMGQTEDGKFRLLASELIPGELKGGFNLEGRRSNDPDDPYDHETRRELRALRVFMAWLNQTDVRMQNSMDTVVEENGRKVLKHYMVDLDSSLGAEMSGTKGPHFGYEHTFDYGETLKAFLAFGFWEKPWQKRQRLEEGKENDPEVGYFSNMEFRPEKFKTQLPHLAFKDLTRADGFWAAKLMMKFTNEDLAAIVKTAQYSSPESADKVTELLAERRDIIARYWFTAANPLDSMQLNGSNFTFEDLGVKYKFFKPEDTVYSVEIFQPGQKKAAHSFVSSGTSVNLESGWGSSFDVKIRVSRSSNGEKPGPWVLVQIRDQNITGIQHQD